MYIAQFLGIPLSINSTWKNYPLLVQKLQRNLYENSTCFHSLVVTMMIVTTTTRIEREKFPTHYQLYLEYGSKLGWHVSTLWDQLPRWIGQKHFYYLYYQWSRICSGFTQNLDLWGPGHDDVRRHRRRQLLAVQAVGASPNRVAFFFFQAWSIFRKCAQRQRIIGDKCSSTRLWDEERQQWWRRRRRRATCSSNIQTWFETIYRRIFKNLFCSSYTFFPQMLHGLRFVGTFLQSFFLLQRLEDWQQKLPLPNIFPIR